MTTQLYKEAILEAKQLRKVAENNATRAVIEAITPRIRNLIENQILSEDGSEEGEDDILMGALSDLEIDASDKAGISIPDDEGKVTLDLDSLITDPDSADEPISQSDDNSKIKSDKKSQDSDDKFLLDTEAVTALMALREAIAPESADDILSRVSLIRKGLDFCKKLLESDLGREKSSLSFVGQLCEKMFQELRTLKEGVIGIGGVRSVDIDSKIASLQKEIIEMNTRRKLTEKDVMMRLTLPDDADVDLDDLDVEIVPEEDKDVDSDVDDLDHDDLDQDSVEEESETEDGDLTEEDLLLKITGFPEDENLDPSDLDVDIVDDEGEVDIDREDEDKDEDEVLDFDSLDDDDVVEIDEGMLKRELMRMRQVMEGSADDPNVLDDFGGAKKERELFVDSDDSDLNKYDSVGTVKVEVETLRRLKSKSRQNRALRKQVAELRTVVDDLTRQLREQNLFNAKLLYVNRLMHAKELNERQLKSIVKSLDRAQSLREVRLLYKSFADSLKKKSESGSLHESVHRSLGGSSRMVGRSGSSSEQRNDDITKRWAQLAGLST